jgi:hypothetical protein
VKKQMAKHTYLLIAMLSLITVVACGKKDEGTAVAVVPAPAVTYVMQNGSCVQSGTTTVVAATLCPSTSTSNGFYSNGSSCYQNGTNAYVGPAPCPQQIGYQPGFQGQFPPGYTGQVPVGYTPGVGGSIGIQVGGYFGGTIGFTIGGGYAADLQCRGTFYHENQGWVICNGYNCSGMVLFRNRIPVFCP